MDNLRQCFTNYDVVLKVDRNDPTLREYLSKAYPEIILALGKSDSKVHAINRDIPDSDWYILVNTSDDIIWKEGAGEQIKREIGNDTFLHFPEVYVDSQVNKGKDNISVVSIMDWSYYTRFGYVYHPDYKSLYCDNEATEVARRLGRYKFVNKYIFEHMHPAAGKAKKDNLHKLNESFGVIDKKTFLTRQAKNFYVETSNSYVVNN